MRPISSARPRIDLCTKSPPRAYDAVLLRLLQLRVPLRVRYTAVTACMYSTPVTVAAAYPQSIVKGTSTCSSPTSTASYETYVAGRRNLDVLFSYHHHQKTGVSFMKQF